MKPEDKEMQLDIIRRQLGLSEAGEELSDLFDGLLASALMHSNRTSTPDALLMLIATKEKEVELKLKTRLMLLLEERLHIEDTQLFWQKAAQAGNIRVLTTAILILSDGVLKKLEDAADLLDAYLDENSEVSVQNLYIDLLTEINERGFFGQKMTKERLKAWLEEPALEFNEIVNRAVDKVAEGMMASELGAR